MELYPTLPADASPVASDIDDRGVTPGIVAMRPADLRRPGRGGVSALLPGPAGRPVTSGEDLVFCHQVTVAPAVMRRSGQVQAGGWLPLGAGPAGVQPPQPGPASPIAGGNITETTSPQTSTSGGSIGGGSGGGKPPTASGGACGPGGNQGDPASRRVGLRNST
jgi:hypothetical protein